MRIAGAAKELFNKSALRAIFRNTGGVPRLINNLCDRALMDGYSRELKSINAASIKRASDESLPPAVNQSAFELTRWPTIVAVLLVSFTLVLFGIKLAPMFSSDGKQPITEPASNTNIINADSEVERLSRSDILNACFR